MLCSNGSVVVKYELAVKKEKAAETMITIVSAIKEVAKNGSFGNFTADADSITATSEWT